MTRKLTPHCTDVYVRPLLAPFKHLLICTVAEIAVGYRLLKLCQLQYGSPEPFGSQGMTLSMTWIPHYFWSRNLGFTYR